jgi:hypothetical protein
MTALSRRLWSPSRAAAARRYVLPVKRSMAPMMESVELAITRKTMLWRKRKHVEDGQHDIDDQRVLQVFRDPLHRGYRQGPDKVEGERGRNGERDVHGRARRSYPDHAAARISERS